MANDQSTLFLGDCIGAMRTLEDDSVDALVTDPPYGINFLGKAWDGHDIAASLEHDKESRVLPEGRTGSGFGHGSSIASPYDFSPRGQAAFMEWTRRWAVEAERILKPGAWLISFASGRTYHRMTCGLEDARFEIKDQLLWIYGSGFPKARNVGDLIDENLGVKQDIVGQAEGWDTSVTRPGFSGEAHSKVAKARRTYDLTEATSDEAKQWANWGTALKPAHEPMALCRKPLDGTIAANVLKHGVGGLNIAGTRVGEEAGILHGEQADFGRWPTNVVLSHLPECKGSGTTHTDLLCAPGCPVGALNLVQNAARFFYVAKTRRRERIGGTIRNLHPTVKPIDLMRYLVRLVTPPGGVVLDPFMGSGSTGCACMVEGFGFVGMEREQESFDTALARISDYAFARGRSRPEVS